MVRQTIRTPGSALYRTVAGGWGPHEENTARLLEAQHYWLDLHWTDRITDPDDPKVKRDRAEAKRQGIRPPEHPLIPPVAHRPAELAEQRWNEFIEQASSYQAEHRDAGGKRQVTSAEFDALLGL
ncbi:hypothetical protein LCD36_04460 [Saccharopolyspora sp. 6T]|uniref:hypothetical protein n=1 Tax=Saccharopolyspora sp. 6T TaxID=2877238 RepID=UPI001CD1CC90|nr:hypothetical protein [Saccharopolyspora sp. 6T]MCA1185704.1 hypothetical protein [Saccharopolyspora sp. 6T]